ncbi:MAG: hypothetical protein Q8Q94_01975 [bacterium]|nr:hypothetical protein [bacterium]MDZ4299719.1 hypothetical protein [Candidatus Sungbacteria bacterium]
MQQVQTWQDNPNHWRTVQATRIQDGYDDDVNVSAVQEAIDELREGKPDKAIAKLEIWQEFAYEDSARDPQQLAVELETSVEMALGSIEIAASDAKRLLGWIRALRS